MTTNDAIQFLGGPENDRFRHVVILYLLKDKQHMLEALNDYDKNTTSDVAWVIANWMARRTVEPHNRRQGSHTSWRANDPARCPGKTGFAMISSGQIR